MTAAEPLGPVIERVVDAYLRQHGREAMAALLDPRPHPRTWEGLFARRVPFWRFVDAMEDPGVGTGLRRECIRATGSSLSDVELLRTLEERPPRIPVAKPLVCKTPYAEDHDLALRKIEALAGMRPDLMRELAARTFEPREEDDDPVLMEMHPKLIAFWEGIGFPRGTHPDILSRLQTICCILVLGHGAPETAMELGITPDLCVQQPP
ncbi:hypothetical protein KPL78_02225 [Roseomonas sp. HJA6]|uniref:Uncharacterized protein n=1 Tax=Roseomonas alba TaxID=2846776 RepID=A0ABS7A2W1_9PROT|nr:hypothetical protein [Neoroseomonas alba]MBW6396641.1 hypothetical protein [Neoroseomonas alba]